MRLFDVPKRQTDKVDIKNKLRKTKASQQVTRIVSNGSGNLADVVNKMRQVFDDYHPTGVANVMKENAHLLDEFMELAKKNKELAIDTETTGLDPITDKIVGVGLYTPGMDAIYVPLNHVSHISGVKSKGQIATEFMENYLKELKDIDGIKIIYHNAKFDMRVVRWQLGVRLPVYWDTSIGARLLNENEPANLKAQWNKYINKGQEDDALKFGDLVGEGNFIFVPVEIAYKYAARDPKMTFDLYKFQEPYLDGVSEPCIRQGLKETSNLFLNIEVPLTSIVADMEDAGIHIDIDYANELTAKYRKDLKIIEMKIMQIIEDVKKTEAWERLPHEKKSKISDPVNISSPQQLNIIMYDVFDYTNPLAKGKNDAKKGTGAAILEAINTPFTNLIIEYRQVEKLITTYTDKLPTNVNLKTGKIHANFNQIGADTGRFSSSDPNLQNIPSHNKDIRKMFVADGDVVKYLETQNKDDLTTVFVGADYSQQEPRILAHVSGDEQLINAYANNKDIYATVGSIVYNVPYEDCLEFNADGTKNPKGAARRDGMKGVVLGIMYGRGEGSIAEKLGVSRQEARDIIDTFFKSFPKVEKWVNGTIEFAQQYGYVQTAYGRKRRLPDIMLPEYEISRADGKDIPQNIRNNYIGKLEKAYFGQKQEIISEARQQGFVIKDNSGFIAGAKRQAVNSVIQGSAADITKKAILELSRNERLRDLGYVMRVTVHDEIIGTCPIENADEVAKEVSRVMIEAPADKISVPMKVDVECIIRWYGESIN